MVKEDEHWHLVQQDSWSLGVGSHNNKQVLRGLSRFKQQMSSVPKLCSVCHVSTSVMFCKAHDSHLCRACDAKIHGSSPTSTSSSSASSCHEREWLCDVCEQAPAVVSCKADAASLCVNCDNDIHSANPLASRHERLPVTPFHGFSLEPTSNLNSTSHGCHSVECNLSINNNLECTNFLNENGGEEGEESPGQQQLETQEGTNNNTNLRGGREHCYHHEDGVVSWMLPPDSNKSNQLSLVSAAVSGGDDRSVKDKLKFKAYLQSMDFLQDVDSYVDLEYLASSNTSTAPILTSAAASTGPQVGTDSMVPVHTPEVYDHSSSKHSNESGGSLDVDAYKSNYGYRVGSLNQCVPSASLDVGIVPDSQKPNGSQSPFHEAATRTFDMVQRVSQVGDQVEHLMGREARVLRYREKRKNRKFEKTIRYASRKAYAETRPRIKGRFAKRTDVEINGIYPSSSPSPLLPDQQQFDVVSTF